MKLLKSLAVFSLMGFMTTSVLAAEKIASKNNVAKEQKVEKEKVMSDADLKQFNKNFAIRLVGRSVAEDAQTKQQVSIVQFEVENIGKKNIKNAEWTAIFTVNNQAFYGFEMTVPFNKPLGPKAKESITLNMPFAMLPADVQQIFATKEAEVGAINVARKLEFTRGAPIVAK